MITFFVMLSLVFGFSRFFTFFLELFLLFFEIIFQVLFSFFAAGRDSIICRSSCCRLPNNIRLTLNLFNLITNLIFLLLLLFFVPLIPLSSQKVGLLRFLFQKIGKRLLVMLLPTLKELLPLVLGDRVLCVDSIDDAHMDLS